MLIYKDNNYTIRTYTQLSVKTPKPISNQQKAESSYCVRLINTRASIDQSEDSLAHL